MLQIYATQACAVCVKHVSALSLFQAFLQRWEDLGKGFPAVLRHWQFLFAVWDWMELLDSERCAQVAARFDCRFTSIFHLLIVIATISWGPTLYLALGVLHAIELVLTPGNPMNEWCPQWMSDVLIGLLDSCRLRPLAFFFFWSQSISYLGFLFPSCLLFSSALVFVPRNLPSHEVPNAHALCSVLFIVCLVIIHHV